MQFVQFARATNSPGDESSGEARRLQFHTRHEKKLVLLCVICNKFPLSGVEVGNDAN